MSCAEKLTPAERQVLDGILRGMTDKEIARELGKQTNTIKHQATIVRAKFGARNRVELAVAAAREGLK